MGRDRTHSIIAVDRSVAITGQYGAGLATDSLDHRAWPRYKPKATYVAHQHPGQLAPIYALSPPPHICKLELYLINQKLYVSLARVADYKRYKLNEKIRISWAYCLNS